MSMFMEPVQPFNNSRELEPSAFDDINIETPISQTPFIPDLKDPEQHQNHQHRPQESPHPEDNVAVADLPDPLFQVNPSQPSPSVTASLNSSVNGSPTVCSLCDVAARRSVSASPSVALINVSINNDIPPPYGTKEEDRQKTTTKSKTKVTSGPAKVKAKPNGNASASVSNVKAPPWRNQRSYVTRFEETVEAPKKAKAPGPGLGLDKVRAKSMDPGQSSNLSDLRRRARLSDSRPKWNQYRIDDTGRENLLRARAGFGKRARLKTSGRSTGQGQDEEKNGQNVQISPAEPLNEPQSQREGQSRSRPESQSESTSGSPKNRQKRSKEIIIIADKFQTGEQIVMEKTATDRLTDDSYDFPPQIRKPASKNRADSFKDQASFVNSFNSNFNSNSDPSSTMIHQPLVKETKLSQIRAAAAAAKRKAREKSESKTAARFKLHELSISNKDRDNATITSVVHEESKVEQNIKHYPENLNSSGKKARISVANQSFPIAAAVPIAVPVPVAVPMPVPISLPVVLPAVRHQSSENSVPVIINKYQGDLRATVPMMKKEDSFVISIVVTPREGEKGQTMDEISFNLESVVDGLLKSKDYSTDIQEPQYQLLQKQQYHVQESVHQDPPDVPKAASKSISNAESPKTVKKRGKTKAKDKIKDKDKDQEKKAGKENLSELGPDSKVDPKTNVLSLQKRIRKKLSRAAKAKPRESLDLAEKEWQPVTKKDLKTREFLKIDRLELDSKSSVEDQESDLDPGPYKNGEKEKEVVDDIFEVMDEDSLDHTQNKNESLLSVSYCSHRDRNRYQINPPEGILLPNEFVLVRFTTRTLYQEAEVKSDIFKVETILAPNPGDQNQENDENPESPTSASSRRRLWMVILPNLPIFTEPENVAERTNDAL